MRGVRLNKRAWMFVAVAVLLAVASVILARLSLPGAFPSGLGAGLSVVAGVWVARGAAALQDSDSQRRVLKGNVWTEPTGRLPIVGDLADPIVLGVHPAALLGGTSGSRVPPFITREFSGGLLEVLRRERFVLLVGDSTAGKSRAAYEAIRAELPRHRLVQPTCRDAALVAAACAAAIPRTVLWLDDLERFLGSGGLTGAAVREVLNAGGGRCIVATMRSEEYAKFSGRAAFGLEGIGRDALRQGWDVLRLAARIEVPRMWSAGEVAQARRQSEDPRLAEAVRLAGEYGVAEYLAAGPQVLAEWRDAWAPGMHPRAAAMVMAAVDARRAGVHRPLPLGTLLDLHEPYLRRRGGQRLRPESPQRAVAWATTPLYATTGLLIRSDGGFLAFDYLIDRLDQERIPAGALDALIPFATPGEALDIGQLAWDWSLISQADAAFQRAEATGLFEATARRSYLIGERRGSGAGLRFAQEAAEWTAAVFGPDHPQTLEARSLVAWQTGFNGDPVTAIQQLQNIAALCEAVLGADHKLALDMRMGVAAMTAEEGNCAAAAQQYLELADHCARILGDDHRNSIVCRDQAALWLSEAGNPHEAARMYRALLTDMTQRFRSSADDIFHTRCQVASCLAQAGEYGTALLEWDQLSAKATAMYGRLRSSSLYVRLRQAWCVGEAGKPVRAVELLERLLADVRELDEPESVDLIFARRSLAWWIGEAGNPGEAQRQLLSLIEETSERRGADDRRVKVLHLMLTHWKAFNDSPNTLAETLKRSTVQLSKELGPGHDVTRAARRHFARFHQPSAGAGSNA